MGSGYIGEEMDLEQVDAQTGRGRRRNDPQSGDNNNKALEGFSSKSSKVEIRDVTIDSDVGGDINLYSQLWHACAGPLVNVSRIGDKVYYFPQGHIEQVVTYMNQDGNSEMPIYKIPCKILCKVVNVVLKAEANTDEVFAQITLLPLAEEPISDVANSSSQLRRSPGRAFIKRLTPSDRSMHGGFSIPKRYAKDFFPPLDMSQEIPTQELVAKDLHGTEWKFRHIYRGQPKRHLITSGWSKFLADRRLDAGDSSVFVSGENGELYVGIRRATRPQYSASATVLSSLSVQHGILATAYHAVSSGSIFTVYYRPWSGSADFIIPYDRYMKSAEIDYSVGTRFRMQFGSEECSEHKSQVYGGTIAGIEDVDCVRWRDSEWRRLKVQWDFISDVHVLPGRVSHWSIEPIGVTKKRRIIAADSHSKRAHPSDSSATQIPFVLKKDILESPAGYTHQTQSGVLQGQEIRAVGASERGTSAQPILPHWNLQPNPGQGQMLSSITGNQNHQPSKIRDPLSLSPGSSVSLPDENTPNFELDNFYRAILASKGNCVEASGSLRVPNANFISPKSQEDWRASEKGNGKEVGQTQPNASGKFMLFGANLSESPSKLLSPQTVVSTEHTRLSSVPPAISQPRFSEAIHVSDPSMGDYRNLPENQWKNYWSSTNRTCTKVLKYGTALGRSVDLRRFCGYKELIFELDKLFDFNGALADGKDEWKIIFEDCEGDMLLLGDCQWPEFRGMVRKMFIYPKEEVDKMNTRRTK